MDSEDRVPCPPLPLTLGQHLFLHVVILAEVDVGFEVGKSLGGSEGDEAQRGRPPRPQPVPATRGGRRTQAPGPPPPNTPFTWVRVSLQRW